jgi:outer membrane protein assembly factor BamA
MEAGAAYAYGYTNVLPFIKQFYSGGPNGLRGWRVRSIGPGAWFDSSANTLTLNQTGDIKLEGNLEYRFDIWGYIKGALFVDAGNIWLLRKDTLRPNANFEFNKFYNQLAVAGGFGLRSDFDYFVIRFDIGVPIVSPYLPVGNKYLGGQIQPMDADWRKRALKYNLAIGYPF